MSKQGPKRIAVHINELVLPRGSRMPDQATLRRMVEAEVQRRLAGASSGTTVHSADPLHAGKDGDIAADAASHVQRHLDGRA